VASEANIGAVFAVFLVAWPWRQPRAIGEHALSKDKNFWSLHTEGMTSKWVGFLLGHCFLVAIYHPDSFGISPALALSF
jgi:hypothetical protein